VEKSELWVFKKTKGDGKKEKNKNEQNESAPVAKPAVRVCFYAVISVSS